MQLPLSILVIDDEKELATLFKEFIMGIGFNAESFTNPLLAFEYFKYNKNKYSLIITDLRMPGLCGLELACKVRELNSLVKLFLISAFDTADLESNPVYQSAKIDKILQKPIKLSMLKKIIEQTFN